MNRPDGSIHRGKSGAPIDALFAAFNQLRTLGWREMMYAPRDGTPVQIIELGSTGIHEACWMSFDHGSLNICGSFFADGDYPSRPALWRPIPNTKPRQLEEFP